MVAIFTAEIRCMMYVFGDVETPCSETAERIENLVRQEIRKLLIETNAGEPSISDLLFTLRSGSHSSLSPESWTKLKSISQIAE
jgi:hypothetical protein